VKSLRKPARIALGVLVVALLALAIQVGRVSGAFRSFHAGFSGTCSSIALAGSAEDIQIDRERGLAYLSVLDRASLERGAAADGSVMLLDLNLAVPAPRAALAFDPQNFRPHGLSLLKKPGMAARLFAISRGTDGIQTVEIAEQASDGAFVPKESVRSPAFVHPNALVAVGPRQFYLVNDRAGAGEYTRLVDLLFRRTTATLVYYDGDSALVLDSRLQFPAGIALSPDGTHLYVGEALAGQMRVYRRDTTAGTLSLEEVVSLDTAPDNLNVDDDGVVWIAAHPKLLKFIEHLRHPEKRAPTQVLRFDPREPTPAPGALDTRLTQVYGDEGSQITAGSVAAHWRDEFLVGAVLEPKVLVCKLHP
jgi:arylesterase/paraoxonase